MPVDASKAGSRLRSANSDVEVVVVRPATQQVVLSCGGATMVALDDSPSNDRSPKGDEVTTLGKRYVDAESGLELLCTKGGAGALTVDGRALSIKGAQPLPSSD
jgi:hypothetical protein